MPILRLFCMILNFICKRNFLSFDLVPLKRSINSNLILIIPISLTLLSNTYVLLFIWSTISFKSFIVTTYESNNFSLFIMLVFSSYKVVALNVVATGALKSIASTVSLYYNLGSECVTEPYTVNTMRSNNGLGM